MAGAMCGMYVYIIMCLYCCYSSSILIFCLFVCLLLISKRLTLKWFVYLLNFDITNELSPLSGVWNRKDNSSRADKACHVTIPADDKAHKTAGSWNVLLAIKTASLGRIWAIVQELCESRGGRPGLSVLTSLLVSVDVKLY